MRAARVISQDPNDALAGLDLVEVPSPEEKPGYTLVKVRATSVNPHDLWTLRGVGHPADRVPMTLGCEAAGTTPDGREVIVHGVIGDPERGGGDVTFDPKRHLLSERIDGGLADEVLIPDANLVDKPEWLSWEEAGCVGVAFATAYRMLFTRARIKAGQRVLVQGSSGGVSSAAIKLASAAGAVVYATGRTEEKRAFALECGARQAVENGARLPERVDVVVDTVGEATWEHSVKSLKPGGVIVTCGATSGDAPSAQLTRVFYLQLSVLGSTMCTRSEFEDMLRMMEATGVRPVIDSVVPLAEVKGAFARLEAGEVRGNIVVTP